MNEEEARKSGRYGQVLIALEEARELLLAKTAPLPAEAVRLIDAMDRTIAEPIRAERPLPLFDRSALDGYAVASRDLREATQDQPVHLFVQEEVPAGHQAKQPLATGRTIKVMTGAPLPEGADAVVGHEFTTSGSLKDAVFFRSPVVPGQGVAPKGEEYGAGELAIPAGAVIGAAESALLAALRRDPVRVRRRPRIGLFGTGDELWEGDGTPPPGKIRPTNVYALAALVRQAGGEPVLLGTAADRREAVADVFRAGLEAGLDLVISTGGVSAGDYDVVKDALYGMDAEMLFWKVALRPGAPAVAARWEKGLLIGLSGNPAGAVILFILLVAPVIASLSGRSWSLPRSTARLAAPFAKRKGLRGFLWGKAEEREGRLWVRLLDNQKCGGMRSFLESNCLVEVPAGAHDWPAGRETSVLWLPKGRF
ncbi:molybdopterin molybdenumtransferase MoeA [Heliobacterium gestii]|uniref:Molybdopterin molybdenumtransferase n=1 Tax=Heliomicrobium gestii TaxID=2699 RepID=A0A845L6F0_HELGE|nr:gephyrin-like molybdotransferase Glp [Heliomicrobium gestii]MBM7865537.1 molybdopterin molybdotransferase [Heliomicrobium gestii]MZP41788.1 molybdopterin molybdenumtransferase MoeA [Heliomicrobium gestii]